MKIFTKGVLAALVGFGLLGSVNHSFAAINDDEDSELDDSEIQLKCVTSGDVIGTALKAMARNVRSQLVDDLVNVNDDKTIKIVFRTSRKLSAAPTADESFDSLDGDSSFTASIGSEPAEGEMGTIAVQVNNTEIYVPAITTTCEEEYRLSSGSVTLKRFNADGSRRPTYKGTIGQFDVHVTGYRAGK